MQEKLPAKSILYVSDTSFCSDHLSTVPLNTEFFSTVYDYAEKAGLARIIRNLESEKKTVGNHVLFRNN